MHALHLRLVFTILIVSTFDETNFVLGGENIGASDITTAHHQTNKRTLVTSEDPASLASLRYVCSYGPEMYLEPGINAGQPTVKFRLGVLCCPEAKKDHRGICMPHCEGGCGEGSCIKPGLCLCNNAYCVYHIQSRTCKCPVCPSGCTNGVCVANNICRCNPGFMIRDEWTSIFTNSAAQCVPYCFPFCTNSFFIEPKYCECDYSSSEEDDSSSIETNFGKRRKSKKRLHKLFGEYGHPGFGSGFETGVVVGSTHGSSDHYNYGSGSSYGYGTGTNYGYETGSNNVPGSSISYGSGFVINYGSGSGEYGTGGIYGQRYNPATGNNYNTGSSLYVSGKNTNTGVIHGLNVNNGGGHVGWVVPGSSKYGTGSSFSRSGSGSISSGNNYGWVTPGSNSGNIGRGTGSISTGNSYGWVKPESSSGINGHGTASSSSGGYYGSSSGTSGHLTGSSSSGSSGSSSSSSNSRRKPGRKPSRG